jgi:hypothetical protein
MIETLQELVKASGVERMTLSIQNTSEARVAVAIQCVLGQEPKEPSDIQRVLRQALAQPILVEGITGEVDAKLDSLLTEYVRAVRPHADSLITNVKVAKDKVERAGASVKADSDNSTEEGDKKSLSPDAKVEEFATNEAESL